MKKVIIIGGGLAGLSSAVNLIRGNFEIHLFESSPILGGRVKSYFDKNFNSYLDNGQHLLIEGYNSTIKLIDKINATNNFFRQNKFKVVFRDRSGSNNYFTIPTSINSIIKLLNFNLLSMLEKLALIKFLLKLKNLNENFTENMSVKDFLKAFKQSENLIKNFWSLLCESALNTPIATASTRMFLVVIKKMFLENPKNANFVYPKKSLYESLIKPLEDFLVMNDVKIYRTTRITKLIFGRKKVTKVLTSNGNEIEGDYFIIAVHPSNLNKLLPFIKLELNYHSILNLYLKVPTKNFGHVFFALWDSKVHWVFFKENYIVLTRSVADELIDQSNDSLVREFTNEFLNYFPELGDEILNIQKDYKSIKLIKEKKATFSSDLNSNYSRPSIATDYENVFLAGDYVNTGFPSTIESAVLSGEIVANEIMSQSGII